MERKWLESLPGMIEKAIALATQGQEDDMSGYDEDTECYKETMKVWDDHNTMCVEVRDRPNYFNLEVFPINMDGECGSDRPMLSVTMESEAWLEAKLAALTSNQPLVASPI